MRRRDFITRHGRSPVLLVQVEIDADSLKVLGSAE